MIAISFRYQNRHSLIFPLASAFYAPLSAYASALLGLLAWLN